MAGEYHTVFEVSYLSNGSLLLSLAFLCVGVAAVVGVYRSWKKQQMHLLQKIMFVGIWAPLWFFGSGIWLYSNISDGRRLTSALASGQCGLVEGTVKVLHQEPWSGHDPGDHIQIAGKDFTYSYGTGTLTYHQTIAHGGKLKDGVTARLHYLGNAILKVEIKQ
jgi:hypothetical protein